MKTVRLLGFLVIASHRLVAVWHLLLAPSILLTMTPAQAWSAIVLLTVAHLAVFLAWWFLPHQSTGALLFLLFALALAFGSYEPFLSASPNNILRMSSGDGVTAFRLSSAFLFLLEAAACRLGLHLTLFRETNLNQVAQS